MTRAEQAALKAYPHKIEEHPKVMGGSITFDANNLPRGFYLEGYEQAEKDIITLIESRIGEILGDAQPAPVLRIELQGLIKRIKEEQNDRR